MIPDARNRTAVARETPLTGVAAGSVLAGIGLVDGAANRPRPLPLAGLFLTFLRLGATSFGGPAMVANIREMSVTRKQWLDGAVFARGVALCQALPGATAMQTAAYVGLRVRGLAGGAIAYAGFGLPAFCAMLALSALFARSHDVGFAVSLFRALRVVVVAIVASAALTFATSYIKRRTDALIAAAAAAAFAVAVNPLLTISLAGLAGSIQRDRTGAGDAVPSPPNGNAWRPLAFVLGGAAIAMAGLLVVNRQLFTLAAAMLRIDVFAFGGGYASLSLMQHQFVQALAWLDGATFTDGVALGQVTPGPIVMTATFIGYVVTGAAGAVVATVAILFPSFVVLVLALPWFDRLQMSARFRGATHGALASFVGLLGAVACRFAFAVDWTIATSLIAGAAFLCLRLRVHTIWLVAGAVVYASLRT